MTAFTDAELIAFLDEALPSDRSVELEAALRSDTELQRRLVGISGRQIAGLHTIAAIWQRARLSCPRRSQLGQFLLGALGDEETEYIRFHIKTVGCRYCEANLADLQLEIGRDESSNRRQRYFQTSAGYLGGKK
ncbi:hypothetical protein OAL35_00785 [bacterium]|nr:hypothetical protein [bacterium]